MSDYRNTYSLSLDYLEEIKGNEREYLNNPAECLQSDEEDIIRCLASGCSLGIFCKGSLIAYSLAYFTDYGTAYVDKCFVVPQFRGNGYQYKLLEKQIEKLQSKGVRDVYAMTSPSNIASKKSFEKAGFRYLRETVCHGEKRIILKVEL